MVGGSIRGGREPSVRRMPRAQILSNRQGEHRDESKFNRNHNAPVVTRLLRLVIVVPLPSAEIAWVSSSTYNPFESLESLVMALKRCGVLFRRDIFGLDEEVGWNRKRVRNGPDGSLWSALKNRNRS
jgi:hypothetical protein